MIGVHGRRQDIAQREAMARALKTGVYAAPALLFASALAERVGTSLSPVPTSTCGAASVVFSQDALLLNVTPGSAIARDAYSQRDSAKCIWPPGSLADAITGFRPS